MLCPRCQTNNNDTARFCPNCGQALEAQTAPRPAEGERKLVTVLFADVVGSTAMGERLDPELVTEVMNGAFGFMNSAVDHYGGTVSRLLGDAVLAIFGAPAAHEDDPERAVRAGLEIQRAAKLYAAKVQTKYGVEFHVRVGIHTGLAVLDRVGDHIRAEYTAMGDTPNVAARMQSSALPDMVLVSADTHRLTQHAFEFEPRGPQTVKGKSAPIETWQAVGVRARPTSGRGLEGLRAPMVGRQVELEKLQARLRAMRPQQSGAWVTVAGEAGLGKSRLVAELRHSLTADSQASEVAWFEGRCTSYSHDVGYLPWREILRQSLGTLVDEPEAGVRARLRKAVDRQPLRGDDLSFLEVLLAVADEESLKAVAGYAGDDFVRRMTEAVRAYFQALAQTRPLVLVFEDLHWADEASLSLLGDLCDLVSLCPILIMGLMRLDRDTPAWALAEMAPQKLPAVNVDEIVLSPLSSTESKDLLGLLLKIEDLPEQVRGLILEKSEGNPFFVEEVIRSLLDAGYIVREQGYWRATREIEKVAIPNTLAGLLAARLDALPEEAKRVGQMAAVLGRTFTFRELETICGAAPVSERIADIAPPLELLTRQEIIHSQLNQPEPAYVFKHALTQEAAYNSLLLRRRREFHGRAGVALEQLYADRLAELAPTLAHHFWEAEDWERAAVHAQRAGDGASKIYALREAMRHYDRVVSALDKLGGDHEVQLYEALMGWARSAFKFRPYTEQIERLVRAEQIARHLGDKRRLAVALHALGAAHLARGHSLRAVPVFGEAFSLAQELGDETLSIIPSFHAAFMKMDTDAQAAVPMFDRTVELARKYKSLDLEAYGLSAKGMALARLGRFSDSQAALIAAFGVVQGINSPVTESDVELFAGWAYLDMGNVQAGLEHGQRGVELAIATDNFDCICGALACVGFGHMQSGQLPEAARDFQNAMQQTKVSGALRMEVLAAGGLALTKLAGGQMEALAELEEAAARADELHDFFTAAFFSQAAAEAHLGQGDLAGTQAYLDKALEYFQRNNMGPYLARTQATEAALREKRAV